MSDPDTLRWFIEEHSPSEVVRLLEYMEYMTSDHYEVNEGRVVKIGTGSGPGNAPKSKSLNAVAGKRV